ncbi:hypothetical protein I4U23_022603 [Adineta vaga]|nr:hypothetical protein I4U23_022603 [Adineta vaga]
MLRDRCNIIYRVLSEINLFETEIDDEHSKRNEILSTRWYIIILILILSLITLYTLLQSQTNIITISFPTKNQYEQIKSFNNLQCKCEQISISYKHFLNIIPQYNEICLSDFISEKWINYLFSQNLSYHFQLDFRHDASSRFQLLRTLCQQSAQTINDNLNEFYSLELITNELISMNLFHSEINTFIELFKIRTISSFQNLLKLIRQTTIVNGLLSGIETCFVYAFHPRNLSRIFLAGIYYYENSIEGKIFDCYCDQVTACQNPQGIYGNINRYDYPGSDWPDYPVRNPNTEAINATYLIPGFVVGCRPIESLLRSTSECLFEQKCLNQIGFYINYTSISIDSFSILNQSESIRNITIETLANNLFVKQWIIEKSYEKYFDYCQPLFCQYKIEQKQSFIQIFATIISLYGGLRIVLQFIIPNIVKFIRKKRQSTNDEINIPKGQYCIIFIHLHIYIKG